uniref:DASH complex subunit SPC34 n=1 Tax=Colletotrichum fructicola (strain Nara gc5) TaxID=1213859 RepID=L2G9N3_COLFN
MSMLSIHLEQIALSCEGIDSLPFPPPKIFTNAMLYNSDITSLIRDTEAHERALFSVPPPPAPATSQNPDPKLNNRRQTVFNVASGEVTTGPPATRGGGGGGPRYLPFGEAICTTSYAAASLCGVYALPGALERIPQLRNRYAHQTNTLAYYEAKVAEQQAALERMNKDHWMGDEEEPEDDDEEEDEDMMTEEEYRAEEELVRDLDRKKRELQQRLRAMDKDLGGLLNM